MPKWRKKESKDCVTIVMRNGTLAINAKEKKKKLLEDSAFEVEHAHSLRLVELDDNGDDVIELEEQDDKAEITLYAFVGNPSPNTMRVKSKIKDQEVMSLLDSGSAQFLGRCYGNEVEVTN